MQPSDQPGTGPTPEPQPRQPLPQPPAAPPAPAPPAVQQLPSAPVPQQSPITQPEDAILPADDYVYDDEYDDDEEIDLSEPVNWSAKEYIHQEKDAKWFIVFAIVLIAFIAVAIFLMKSITFAILLVVIAGAVIVLAKRPPREIDYSLSNDGLHIGETLHRYGDFKSFGIIHDGQEFSVMLVPRRRLQPGITVYFPEEAGEDIVDVLGSRLPMKDLHMDVIDRLVRALRL